MKQSHKKRILIVEDENHIAEGLKLNLTMQGFKVKLAFDGTSALALWKQWRPDLVVLDVMLPDINGLAVLQNIRLENERLPILILSAKATAEDKIKGLKFGVDDYLAKPFELEEFLLRITRLIKRSGWTHQEDTARPATEAPGDIYKFGTNRIDFKTGMADCCQGRVQLTEQELKLLRLFIIHQGKPMARDKILEIGWGYTGGMTTRTVDNFIVRFRKYFETNPRRPKYFRSIRSVGYLFEPGTHTHFPNETK